MVAAGVARPYDVDVGAYPDLAAHVLHMVPNSMTHVSCTDVCADAACCVDQSHVIRERAGDGVADDDGSLCSS